MLDGSAVPWLGHASRNARHLVAVSGGADSVALLHLLAESGFKKLIVCHLNHRLRGRASATDASFVRKLAESLDLPCEIGTADVRKLMTLRSESMETAARRARHGFFAHCARKFRCHRVLLAHHADDQAETVLWNLLRGSNGLKGMREDQEIGIGKTRLHLIRPLLGVRRSELESWLLARGIRWREDQSNMEAVAVRNRLRNEALPLLAEISGRDPVPALIRGAADQIERDELEASLMQERDLLDPRGRLHLPALRLLPRILQRTALRGFLIEHGVFQIDRPLLDRCLALTDPEAASSVNLPGNRRLRRRAGRLWLDP